MSEWTEHIETTYRTVVGPLTLTVSKPIGELRWGWRLDYRTGSDAGLEDTADEAKAAAIDAALAFIEWMREGAVGLERDAATVEYEAQKDRLRRGVVLCLDCSQEYPREVEHDCPTPGPATLAMREEPDDA